MAENQQNAQRRPFVPHYLTVISRKDIDVGQLKEHGVLWFFGSASICVFKSTEESHGWLVQFLQEQQAEIKEDTMFFKMFQAGDHPNLNTQRAALQERFGCAYVHYTNSKAHNTTYVFMMSATEEQHKDVLRAWKTYMGEAHEGQEQADAPVEQTRPQHTEKRNPPAMVDTKTRNLFKDLKDMRK